MLCRLRPLSPEDVILLSPFLALVLGQIPVSKDIVLQLRYQESLAVNYQRVPTFCLIKDVVNGCGAILSVSDLQPHFLTNFILCHLEVRTPVEPRHIYLVFQLIEIDVGIYLMHCLSTDVFRVYFILNDELDSKFLG